jgi:hypothetical protein
MHHQQQVNTTHFTAKLELTAHAAACCLQEAAGMFGHLKEIEASKVDNPRPVDLSPECLSMMEKLMMAQAQVRAGL